MPPRPHDVAEQAAAASARQLATQQQFVSHCRDEQGCAFGLIVSRVSWLFSSNLGVISVECMAVNQR